MNFGKEFEKYAVKHRGISSNTLDGYIKHNVTNLTPNIIEERPMNIAVMDVYSRLMMDRIIFMGYPVTDEVANIITAQFLFLESTDRTKDIQMYINSPGGSVYAGLGMYDTMQFVSPDIATICTGIAASMAAVLMCAGSPGKRTALKHSRIMLHQPSGGAGGQASGRTPPGRIARPSAGRPRSGRSPPGTRPPWRTAGPAGPAGSRGTRRGRSRR